MSERAIAYVRGQYLADPAAARVFRALAERTEEYSWPPDPEAPMGLLLQDGDIPAVAARLGLSADRFRDLLRELRRMVPMDVLEHPDGVWEIVYGPVYTSPPEAPGPSPAKDGDPLGPVNPFTLPGWEDYSTWGLDTPFGRAEHASLYAQLYRNTDDRDAEPRIWITPPRFAPTTLDQLAAAIAVEIAPYMPVPMPPEVVTVWLAR